MFLIYIRAGCFIEPHIGLLIGSAHIHFTKIGGCRDHLIEQMPIPGGQVV